MLTVLKTRPKSLTLDLGAILANSEHWNIVNLVKIIHSKHPHLWSDRPFRRQPCVELASWLANWHYCTVLHLLLSAPIS